MEVTNDKTANIKHWQYCSVQGRHTDSSVSAGAGEISSAVIRSIGSTTGCTITEKALY